jgi:hypothetical protein
MLDKQGVMAKIVRNIIMDFFQQPKFEICTRVIIRVMFVGYVHKNVYLEVVPIHVLITTKVGCNLLA